MSETNLTGNGVNCQHKNIKTEWKKTGLSKPYPERLVCLDCGKVLLRQEEA